MPADDDASGSEDAAELRGGAARGNEEAAAAAIATIRSAAQQVPWALSRWCDDGDRCGDSISDSLQV